MVNLSHSSIMTPEGVCVCVWGGGGGGEGAYTWIYLNISDTHNELIV